MQQTEEADYVNERPRREQKRRRDTNQTERRLCQLLFLSFGLLFIIQALLNISLRLTLYSSKESTQLNCNATDFSDQKQVKEEEKDCEKKKSGQYNRLQERFNALTREKNLLENRNTELTNMIRNLHKEMDRLRAKLSEMSGCMCPTGWMWINSRCYFLSTEERTWDDSRKYCQSRDADLVVINSEEEQRSLYRLDGNDGLLFWIGLHDPTRSAGTAGWKWVDGSPLTKSFWSLGQPDRGVKVENCVQMYHFHPELANWHDMPCSILRRWLCEKAQCPRL